MDSAASHQAIRTVPWRSLPLGCVVLDWPVLSGASIPELTNYPVMTERLRDHLGRTYQFLLSRSVVIADPSAGLALTDIRDAAGEGRELAISLESARRLKDDLLAGLSSRPEARDGIAQQMTCEESPYLLTKRWARSVARMLRGAEPFGTAAWPEIASGASAADIAVGMLTGDVPPLGSTELTLDIGFDVSRSMMIDERAGYAYDQALALLERLRSAFRLLSWRLWTVSDDTTVVAEGGSPYPRRSLATVMRGAGVRAGETRFAPFLTAAANRAPARGGHLVVLVTDGECSDRPQTLRRAERLHLRSIDYLQIVLHRDDDYRTIVESASGPRPIDNIRGTSDLADGDRLVTRSDEQLRAVVDHELAAVTDIAEAAHGAQIVLTYFPLFSLVAIDVYERYLGLLTGGINRGAQDQRHRT